MLGQSFFPGGDEEQRRQQEGSGPVNPVQEAIKILSLKLPRVIGANAPVPQLLLTSPGSRGLPSPTAFGPGAPAPNPAQAPNPLEDILRRMMGGMNPPAPNVKVVTDPEVRGTLTNNPLPQSPTPAATEPAWSRPNSNQSDLPEPLPMGPGRRTRSI